MRINEEDLRNYATVSRAASILLSWQNACVARCRSMQAPSNYRHCFTSLVEKERSGTDHSDRGQECANTKPKSEEKSQYIAAA